MRLKCVIAGLALAAVGAGFRATPGVAAVPSQTVLDSQSIVAIRKAYTEIERSLRSYRRARHDLVGFSTEGGYVDAWFEGPHLRKLAATYYGEMGRGSEEYYFVDDSLVFVLAATEHYDRPLTGHVVGRDEDRFYFEAQRLIRWVDSTHQQRNPASHDAEDRARDIQKTARVLSMCARATQSDTAACTAPN